MLASFIINMSRCFPRRSRHLWIFFLLFVCLIGVYLAYKNLITADMSNGDFGHQQHFMREQGQGKKRSKSVDLVPESRKRLVEAHVFEPLRSKDLEHAALGLRNLENDEDYVTNEEMMARLKVLVVELSPSNWKTALDADEMMLQVKSELMDMNLNSKYSCREIISFKLGSNRYRNFYGKKNIDYVRLDFTKELAVKSLGQNNELKIECMKMDYNPERCSSMWNYNLMRELVFFMILDSPSIIKLEGFCLRGETIASRMSEKGAVIVTQAGNEVTSQLLMSFSWRLKAEMCIKMMELLIYMENSPIGSLGFDRLHQPDFVLVENDLKLVDLDNIHVGDPPCKQNSDCTIPEMSRKEIKCVNDVCKGRNAMNNLLWMYRIMILNLLKIPTGLAYNEEIQTFLQQIQELAFTTEQVLQQLNKWLGNDSIKKVQSPTKPAVHVHFGQPDDNANLNQISKKGKDVSKESNINRFEDKQQKPILKEVATASPPKFVTKIEPGVFGNNKYVRHDSANFPAAMTMVMKKSADAKPDTNYGATLFIKKKKGESAQVITSKPDLKDNSQVTSKPKVEVDVKACLKKSLNQTLGARTARERRLLTHLGLKGITEADWVQYAKSVKLVKYLGMSQMSSNKTKGGRFKFEFDKNALKLRKGEFLMENGPEHYHIGYLLAYYVDRVLGLYHIPPTIGRTVSVSEMTSIKVDSKWLDRYKSFIMSDGSGFKGVLTVPVPPVMKTEQFVIDKRENIVRKVEPFSRNQKVQLEYILIWNLVKMMHPQHGYFGYKGHLIHFEADLAFMNLKKSLLGYLYNCQFPNSVYKILICYKCSESHKVPKICGLGQEVIRRAKKDGFTTEDITVGSLVYTDLIQVINNSASSILNIVEHCIRVFSREKVIY